MVLGPGEKQIRRRYFISLLGSTAAVWPLAARAQQPAMPVIGFMSTRAPEESEYLLEAFRQGLKQTGYIEGDGPYYKQPRTPAHQRERPGSQLSPLRVHLRGP